MKNRDDQIGRFHREVELLACLARPTIAFGLSEPNADVLDSLRECKSVAEIILVGPTAIAGIAGFPLVIQAPAEERIADMLVRGEVDGIIRGTLDDVATRKAYERASGGEKFTYSPALLEDPFGRQFFMAPLSNNKGWKAAERLGDARAIAEFVKDWSIKPRIAVYAATRRHAFEASKHLAEAIMAKSIRPFRMRTG